MTAKPTDPRAAPTAPGEPVPKTPPQEAAGSGRRYQRAARIIQIERHVGSLVRMRRIMLGLSQSQLAQLLGVTLQQVNKYERGHSRISSGRLFQMSEALGVPVDFFYQGLSDLRDVPGSAPGTGPSRDRICLEVMRSFGMIKNERHQEALNQLVRALADRSS
ncbi:MAG: helix-turn-helix domain-containing protein [Alphaproteobacteria bacterium]|nr:helix-turn-helix domain-containing protein [Alphaproteobacteria bacterium]